MSIVDDYINGMFNCYGSLSVADCQEAVKIARLEAKIEAIDYYGIDPILKQPLLDNLNKLKYENGL